MLKTCNAEQFLSAARMLRAVAHPDRLKIILLLDRQGPIAVGELQALLGITQSMTSQHLAALKKRGIANYKKKANVCYYFLQNRKVIDLIVCLRQCCRAAEGPARKL